MTVQKFAACNIGSKVQQDPQIVSVRGKKVARRGGLEPPAYRSVVCRSIHLSYRRVINRRQRRGRDSNPRSTLWALNRLAGDHLQPLGHLSTRLNMGRRDRPNRSAYGERGIRTPGTCVQRFSRPPPSTARASLLCAYMVLDRSSFVNSLITHPRSRQPARNRSQPERRHLSQRSPRPAGHFLLRCALTRRDVGRGSK
jgi:hypothetical protein